MVKEQEGGQEIELVIVDRKGFRMALTISREEFRELCKLEEDAFWEEKEEAPISCTVKGCQEKGHTKEYTYSNNPYILGSLDGKLPTNHQPY